MANLIFAQYVDDAIIYSDGVAYHYVGTTASAPNADVGDIGQQNIPAYTFSRSDPQGKTEYSKCEHAVACFVAANVGDVELLVANTEYTVYTAPSDGVIRVWITEWGNQQFFVNGINIFTASSGYGNKVFSYPMNLNSGDVVTVATSAIAGAGSFSESYFLPDTY
jgi:hypothetical protein